MGAQPRPPHSGWPAAGMHFRGELNPVHHPPADLSVGRHIAGRADWHLIWSTEVNATLGILTVWVLAASGIQLGTLWIMKLSILPMLNSLRYDGYVTVCQLIDMHVFHPIAVWNGVIAAGVGGAAAFLAPAPSAKALFI